METATSPPSLSGAEITEAGEFQTIAEDRLEGAEQIGQFIGNLTPRETRRLLEKGHWPCWRGVASMSRARQRCSRIGAL